MTNLIVTNYTEEKVIFINQDAAEIMLTLYFNSIDSDKKEKIINFISNELSLTKLELEAKNATIYKWQDRVDSFKSSIISSMPDHLLLWNMENILGISVEESKKRIELSKNLIKKSYENNA